MDRVTPYTMIALHLRDSTMHLITSSQLAGIGSPAGFGGSSFRSLRSHVCKTVTLNLRDLYRVRCYSFDYNIICILCIYVKFFVYLTKYIWHSDKFLIIRV